MIFETRGARHESLHREGAEITCGWVRNSDADQTSLPPILQTSFTTSQFAENDAAYRPLTQSLSLHSYFLPFLLIDLILIWTMVVSSSRKTSSMHHSGFELANTIKSVTIAGLILWNPYRRVWLIQTRLLMDGLRGVRTRFIPPGTRQAAPPGCQSWLARARCSADALDAPKMHLNASSSQWTMHSVQLALPLISCNWLKKSWNSRYSILHREWLNDKGGVKVDSLSLVIFTFSWGTSWERGNWAVNCNLVLHIQRSGLQLRLTLKAVERPVLLGKISRNKLLFFWILSKWGGYGGPSPNFGTFS